MMPKTLTNRLRPANAKWTRRLTEFLLEQLGNQGVFLDIDILPGVWNSRRTPRR